MLSSLSNFFASFVDALRSLHEWKMNELHSQPSIDIYIHLESYKTFHRMSYNVDHQIPYKHVIFLDIVHNIDLQSLIGARWVDTLILDIVFVHNEFLHFGTKRDLI